MSKYYLRNMVKDGLSKVSSVQTGSIAAYVASNNHQFADEAYLTEISPTGEYLFRYGHAENRYQGGYLTIHQSSSGRNGGFDLSNHRSGSTVVLQSPFETTDYEHYNRGDARWISDNEVAFMFGAGTNRGLSDSHTLTGTKQTDAGTAAFPDSVPQYAGVFLILSGSDNSWAVNFWHTGSDSSNQNDFADADVTQARFLYQMDGVFPNNKYTSDETTYIAVARTGKFSDSYAKNEIVVFKKTAGKWDWYSNVYAGVDSSNSNYKIVRIEWVGEEQDIMAVHYRYAGANLGIDFLQPGTGNTNTKKFVSLNVEKGQTRSDIQPSSFAWDPYNRRFYLWENQELFVYNSSSNWMHRAITSSNKSHTNEYPLPWASDLVLKFGTSNAYLPYQDAAKWESENVQWRFRSGSAAAMYVGSTNDYGQLQWIESGSEGWLGSYFGYTHGTTGQAVNWHPRMNVTGSGFHGSSSVLFAGSTSTTNNSAVPLVGKSAIGTPWRWNTTKGASGDILYWAEVNNVTNSPQYRGRQVLANLNAYEGVVPDTFRPLSSRSGDGETSYEMSSSAAAGITFVETLMSGDSDIPQNTTYSPYGGKFSPDGSHLAVATYYGNQPGTNTTNAGIDIFQSGAKGSYTFVTFLAAAGTSHSPTAIAWASNNEIWAVYGNQTPTYWKKEDAGWNTTAIAQPSLTVASPYGGTNANLSTYTKKANRIKFSPDKKMMVTWEAGGTSFQIRASASNWQGMAWRSNGYNNFEWAGKNSQGHYRLLGSSPTLGIRLGFINGNTGQDVAKSLGNSGTKYATHVHAGAFSYMAGEFMHYLSKSDSLLLSIAGASNKRHGVSTSIIEASMTPFGESYRSPGGSATVSGAINYQNSFINYPVHADSTSPNVILNKFQKYAHGVYAAGDFIFSGSTDGMPNGYAKGFSLTTSSQDPVVSSFFQGFADPNTEDRVFVGHSYDSSGLTPFRLRALERGSSGWKLSPVIYEWGLSAPAANKTFQQDKYFDVSFNGDLVVPAKGGNSGFGVARIAGLGGGDTTAPTISSVAITSATNSQNNLLNTGDVVSVTVTFDEAVTVNTGGGTPHITISVGGVDRNATYASGTGTTAIVFTYTIASETADTDGISIAANQISLNSGTMQDAAGNNATLTHSAVSANSSFKVDTTAPTISSLSMAANNSTVTVTFSEDVYTNSNGTGELAASDFAVSLAGGNSSNINDPSAISISNLSKTSQSIYVLTLSATDLDSIALGTETLTVDSASDTAIYDLAGNAHTAAATVSLNNTAAINDSVTSTIGTGGGTIKAGNNSVEPTAILTVQAGSVDGDVEFTVDVTPESDTFKNGLSQVVHSAKAASKVIRITPHGTRFNADKPVTIKFKLTDTTAGTKVYKRNVPIGAWYGVPPSRFSRDGDEITIQSVSLSDYQAITGDENMARTILNNAQLAKLTQQNKVSGDSVDITGSTGVRTGIAASDQFLVQALTLGVPMQVSASVMREFFSEVGVEATNVGQAHRVIFAEHTGSNPGLKVDESTFTFNPSTNVLTVPTVSSTNVDGILGANSAAAATVTTLTVNDQLVVAAGASITGDTTNEITLDIQGVASQTVDALRIRDSDGNEDLAVSHDGITTLRSLVATTADINAGTVDAIIGGTTPAAGTFTTLTANDQLVVAAGATITGDTTNEITLDIQGVASQSVDALRVRDSDGNEDLAVSHDGITTLRSLVATTADINAGTVDAIIGGTTPAAGTFTTLTANDQLVVAAGATITGDTTNEVTLDIQGVASQSVDALRVRDSDGNEDLAVSHDGITTLRSLVATTADINAGTIDNTIIGGTTKAAGSFTDLVATGDVDLGDATSDTITATGRFDSDLVPSTDGARDLGASNLEWQDLYIDGTAYIDKIGTTGDKVEEAHFTELSASNARIENLDVININTVTQTETHLAIVDKVIMVASGSAGSDVSGAGIQFGGHSEGDDVASILYDDSLNSNNGGFDLNIDGTTFLSIHEGALVPASDGAIDLGTSTLEFNNLFLDGTATVDALVADTADINAGTIDNTVIGGTTAVAGTFTDIAGTTADLTNLEVTNLKAKDGTAAGSIADSTGVVTLNSSVLSTTDINAGTIDNTVIGGTTKAAGSFTNLVAAGNVDLGDAATDTVTVTGQFDSDLIPILDGTSDLGTSAKQWAEAHIDHGYIDAITATGTSTLTTVDINGGAIDGTTIGATSATTAKFTTVSASAGLQVDGNAKFTEEVSASLFVGNGQGLTNVGAASSEVDDYDSNGRKFFLPFLSGAAAASSLHFDPGLHYTAGTVHGAGSLLAMSGAITTGGRIQVADTTEATSTSDGALYSAGGLSVAKSAVIGDDLDLLSNSAVFKVGSDQPFTLTHQNANNTLMATADHRLAFGNAGEYISGDGNDLKIVSSNDIDVTGDMNVVGEVTSTKLTTLASAEGVTTIGSSTAAVFAADGALAINNTTDSTAATNGSLQTDGGLGVAKDIIAGNDVKLLSDSAQLVFGGDGDVTLTHTDDVGLTLNSDNKLMFGDTGTYIFQSADGVLDLVSDTEIEINATTIDINGNVEMDSGLTVAGASVTFSALADLNASQVAAGDKFIIQDADASGVAKEITMAHVGHYIANTGSSGGIQVNPTSGRMHIHYVEQTYLHAGATTHQSAHGYSVIASDITASLSGIPLDNSLQVYLNGLLQTRSGSAGTTFDYEYVADTTPRKIYLTAAIDEDDVLVLKYIKK